MSSPSLARINFDTPELNVTDFTFQLQTYFPERMPTLSHREAIGYIINFADAVIRRLSSEGLLGQPEVNPNKLFATQDIKSHAARVFFEVGQERGVPFRISLVPPGISSTGQAFLCGVYQSQDDKGHIGTFFVDFDLPQTPLEFSQMKRAATQASLGKLPELVESPLLATKHFDSDALPSGFYLHVHTRSLESDLRYWASIQESPDVPVGPVLFHILENRSEGPNYLLDHATSHLRGKNGAIVYIPGEREG